MLHLYDLNHIKKQGLTKYRDLKIERTLDGIEFLSFSYPFKYAENIQEEAYIRTEKNEYVIKEIDDSSDWISVTAKINLDNIKGKAVDRIDVTNTRLEDSINLALAGTGYTATIYANKNKRRTTRKAKCSALDILDEIRKVFRVEYRYDTINKKIYVYEKMGSDKGSYFTDDLNLIKLSIKSNTYDFATRIIPLGKDGMTIESVNGGKNYISNHQYSNKIVEEYWEDNRYTDELSLKEDAIAKLDDISKRVIAYDVDVIDLANASKDKRYKVLDYSLGDTIELKSRDKKVKELQRIVKVTEYPKEPFRNSCEIANRVLRFEDMQQDIIDSSETVDTMTNSDGTIDGKYIESIDADKIVDLEVEVLKAVDLSVINADIRNLKVNKADINDLSAAVGRIGTLEVTSATITQLEVIEGKFERLEADSASIIQLEVANAKIKILEAESGTIKNLVNGNLTSENIQAGAITAGSGIIADGAIGNAQISSLNVDKLESGIIDTSRFTVQGSDGRLKIHDNLLQVFNGQFERVALGDLNKDGSRYGLRVRGSDGTTVLLNENGLTDLGFTDGYEKLSNDSLDPKKIDINKVINRVNEDGSTSISGSKIVVGDKSLDLELSERRIKETELETDISNNTTSITANTNQISLKLDEQSFTSYKSTNDNNISTINTNLSKATTDINVMQGEISLKASKTEVDTKIEELEIGGRNLIRNASFDKGIENWSGNGEVKSVDGENIYEFTGTRGTDLAGVGDNEYFRLKSSQVYVYWIDIRPELDVTFGASTPLHCQIRDDVNNESQGGKEYIKLQSTNIAKANQWTKIVLEFKTKENMQVSFKPYIYYFPNGVKAQIRHIQLEEGTKPSSASIAPEDIQNQIESNTTLINDKSAEIKLTTDNIKLDVIDNQSSLSNKAETSYVDGQISTVNTAITSVSNKASSLETDLNGITGRVSSTETNIIDINGDVTDLTNRVQSAEQKITADAITSTVESTSSLLAKKRDIDNLEIGGRNLLLESDELVENNSYIVKNYNLSKKTTVGETYTYQIKGNLAQGKTSWLFYHDWQPWGANYQNEKYDSKKGIYYLTFIATKEVCNVDVFAYPDTGSNLQSKIEWVKLEKGNKATDWTPAPEDIAAEVDGVIDRVSTAESTIIQQADQISQRVTKDGISSAINQTAQSVLIDASKINLVGAVTVLSDISGNLGSIRAGTLNIGANAFKVDSDGWLHAGKGGFSVPPDADGIYNNFADKVTNITAARWKYSDYSYLFQSGGAFRVYMGAKQALSLERLEGGYHTGLTLINGQGRGVLLKALGSSPYQVQFRNPSDTAYIEVGAAEFKTASNRRIKKDIMLTSDKLDLVKNTPIYNYRLRSDESQTLKTGFIVEDSPSEITTQMGSDGGISIIDTVAVLWKAVQELTDKVERLEGYKT